MRFSCDHCKYRSYSKNNLGRHIIAKHLPRDYESNNCSQCGKFFSVLSSLRSQAKICGLSKEEKRSLMRFTCNYCNYKCETKTVMRQHIQARHLLQIVYTNKCTKYEKDFSCRSTLLRHLKAYGEPEDEKRSMMRFSCDLCDYKCNSKRFKTFFDALFMRLLPI